MMRKILLSEASVRPRVTGSGGRQPQVLCGNIQVHHAVTYMFVAILSTVFSTCTPPPPPVIKKCPEPLWNEYSTLEAYQVTRETSRLEALLAQQERELHDSATTTDTTAGKRLSTLEIRRRLFELAIHRANPVYDVDKIFGYVSYLYQHGGPDSLRYLNWGRAVREQKALIQQRDSLENAIDAISKGERKETRSLETLKKEIKGYVKQCDSLTAVITSQQETIMKLQKLDMMMEQQRSKIQ